MYWRGNVDHRIQRKTLREEVVYLLREKILSGQIAPGQRIIEAELSEELGVSRGPIREAIRQLEQEGLALYTPNKGCSAAELSSEDEWEICLLKGSLEKLSLKLAKCQLPLESIKNMESAIRAMEKAEKKLDLLRISECDELFHRELAGLAKKKRIFETWQTLGRSNFAIDVDGNKGDCDDIRLQHVRHNVLLEVVKRENYEDICDAIDQHYLHNKRE